MLPKGTKVKVFQGKHKGIDGTITDPTPSLAHAYYKVQYKKTAKATATVDVLFADVVPVKP